jgi:catecholate siderophore receptor
MPQFERKPLAAAILMMFSAPVALAQSQSETVSETKARATSETVAHAASGVVAQAASEATLPAVKVQDRKDDFKTESTRGATRTETPLRDIPQFINEVPQALIRSQGRRPCSRLCATFPGSATRQAEGGTQANQVFYLRGFPVNQDFFSTACATWASTTATCSRPNRSKC